MMEPESYPMFAWLCSPWITYVRIARDICINHINLALRDPQNLRARPRNRHFMQRSQVIRPFAKAGEFCWHFFWLGPSSFQQKWKYSIWLSHSVDLETHNERKKISGTLPGPQEGCKRCKMKTAKTCWCQYSSRCVYASRFDYRC